MAFFRRRRSKLRALAANLGDVVLGSFVRTPWGTRGWVGSVEKDGHCTVSRGMGRRDISELKWLTEASANPAFGPDVREGE